MTLQYWNLIDVIYDAVDVGGLFGCLGCRPPQYLETVLCFENTQTERVFVFSK